MGKIVKWDGGNDAGWRHCLMMWAAGGAISVASLGSHAADEKPAAPAAPAEQESSTAPAEPADTDDSDDNDDSGSSDEDEAGEADADTTELSTVTVEGDLQPSATDPVEGYVADRSASATKTDTSVMETPQDITTVTTDQMRDQNATSVGEALRYTGGMIAERRGTNGGRYNMPKLRGFNPEQYMDGLRLSNYQFSQPKTDPFLLERVDVVKGPSSVLYGQAAPGGIVNYVSKRPSKAASNEFFLQGGNDARFRGGFDVGGRLLDDDSLLYRVVAVGERRDGPQHGVEASNFSIAPSLKWQIDDDTELTLLGKYRYDPDSGAYGSLPYEGTVKALPNGEHIKRSFYDGDKDFNHFHRDIAQIGYDFSHDFNDHVKFNQKLRYDHYSVNNRYALGILGWEGKPGGKIGRLLTDNDETRNTFSVDNNLVFDFDTGVLEHEVLAGVDYQKTAARRDDGTVPPGSVPPLDYEDPDYHQKMPDREYHHENYSQYQLGYYLQDQISWGNLILMGSGRYDRVRTAETTDNNRDSRVDHAATFRAGVMYADPSGVSPYFSYSESFQPPTANNAEIADVLDPTRGTQFEAGVKYQPPGQDMLLTASAFRTRQKDAPGPDPQNPERTIQTGKVEIKGVEMNAKASPVEGLDLTMAATWLHSKILNSTEEGVEKGNKFAQTPKYTASLWADYTQPAGPLKGLGGGAGVRYVGSQQADNANTTKVPDYTVADLAVHYELGGMSQQLDGWRVGLNMHNITNKRYAATCSGRDTCFYGAGRETTATMSYHWD